MIKVSQNKTVYEELLTSRSPYFYTFGKSANWVENSDRYENQYGTIRSTKSLTKNDVIVMYRDNVFVDSDLPLAKLVAENIFATLPIIKNSIRYYNSTVPDSQRILLPKDDEHLKERLDKGLCKAQILYKTVFATYSKRLDESGQQSRRNAAYYTCGPHGYNYIKRLLNFNRTYDEFTAILSLDQVFRYLMVITVCQTFYKIPGYRNYLINNQEYTLNIKTGRKFFSPYGIVDLEMDEIKKQVIIEPFTLNFNRNRITEKDFIKDTIERIVNLGEYFKKRPCDTKIIYACEDINAIKGAIELIKKYIPEMAEYIFYTIDREADRYGIEVACLNWDGSKVLPVELQF